MIKCIKCKGTGYIQEYKNYNNGVCYNCNGDGYIFYTKEKIDEFHNVKYLFEIEESLKINIGLDIDIEEYFNMSKEIREQFRIEKEDRLDEINDLIQCSKLDMASDNGYDSYEEYEEAMELEAYIDDYY